MSLTLSFGGFMKFNFSIFMILGLLLPAPLLAADKPLTIALIQEWTQFNPVTINVAATEAVLQFTVRSMLQRDAAGNLIPDIAEKIPSLKDKTVQFVKDKKSRKVVATWKIKDNAKWGDGVDITCADWQMGWTAGMNSNVSVTEKQMYSKVEKIEWSEDKNKLCKVTYANDDWTFDRDLPAFLPKHLELAVYEKFKDKAQGYDQNSIYVKEPTNPGLYSGPYVVSEFVLGSHFVLKTNPYFYGEKPKIASFIVKHVGDTSALKTQLATGEVDIISANGFPADIAILLDQESQKPETKFKVKFQASPIFQGLFLNLDNKILKELAVRKALSHAINKEELSQAFFQGKLSAAENIFPETNPAYVKEKSNYNPKLAAQILQKAGWKKNKNQIFEKNGQELALEFQTSAGIKVLETIQTFICGQLQSVGIKCLAKNLPPRIFLGTNVPHGDFVMGMFGQSVPPDTSLNGAFASNEIATEKNSWAGNNASRWNSPAADKLMRQFNQEWNPKKRTRLMKELGAVLQKELPVITLYHRKEAFILPKNLQGFSEDVSGVSFTYPERWHLN
jgi:peptide/nickel transport system substrate-binding protein